MPNSGSIFFKCIFSFLRKLNDCYENSGTQRVVTMICDTFRFSIFGRLTGRAVNCAFGTIQSSLLLRASFAVIRLVGGLMKASLLFSVRIKNFGLGAVMKAFAFTGALFFFARFCYVTVSYGFDPRVLAINGMGCVACLIGAIISAGFITGTIDSSLLVRLVKWVFEDE